MVIHDITLLACVDPKYTCEAESETEQAGDLVESIQPVIAALALQKLG